MKIQRKIGWQKYEDMIQTQLDSPFLDMISQKYAEMSMQGLEGMTDEQLEEWLETNEEPSDITPQMMVPIDDKMMENINLANNFDCWMGHTNFNITEGIKDQLNETDGIEVLRVCSRHRFFIGVGRMFDFKEVRQKIEDILISGEKQDEED